MNYQINRIFEKIKFFREEHAVSFISVAIHQQMFSLKFIVFKLNSAGDRGQYLYKYLYQYIFEVMCSETPAHLMCSHIISLAEMSDKGDASDIRVNILCVFFFPLLPSSSHTDGKASYCAAFFSSLHTYAQHYV